MQDGTSGKFAVCPADWPLLESSLGPTSAMRTIQELRLLAVWVNPDHMVSTALHLMRGHRLSTLGVVESGRFLGIVNLERLLRAPELEPLARHIEEADLVLQASTESKRAAALFVHEDVTQAPVLQGEKFLGILTSNMLLEELSRSWDPLTNLSWSDRLREWGVERLKAGREIAILFLDIDDFGSYNKKYGHIVGDRILQYLADLLRQFATAEEDVLVRFGGDEFAVGLDASREEAEALRAELEALVEQVELDGLAEPVSVSVGLSGGKRTKERENVHFASTVDNLINLASKACIEAKRRRIEMRGTPTGRPESERPRYSVIEVAVGEEDGAPTIVVLDLDGVSRAAIRARGAESEMESAALTTGLALERGIGEIEVVIDDVAFSEEGAGLGTVAVAGRVLAAGKTQPFFGTRTVRTSLALAAAEATVEGFAGRGHYRRNGLPGASRQIEP